MTRTALITGVTGGIGGAVAERFRSAGWFVIGLGRQELETVDFVDRYEVADLGQPGAMSGVFERLDLDRLDVLVNNAALQVNKALVDTTDDEWESVMNVNLRAAFEAVRAARPALAATRGSVVNIGSVHAVATSINVAAYAISKAALSGLTRSAALELGPEGIRVNAVLPGAVDTKMLREGLSRRPHPDGPEGNFLALAGRTPLGMIAGPEQIAPTVLHLADGDQSPYTTGQCLVVDGGASLRLGTE